MIYRVGMYVVETLESPQNSQVLARMRSSNQVCLQVKSFKTPAVDIDFPRTYQTTNIMHRRHGGTMICRDLAYIIRKAHCEIKSVSGAGNTHNTSAPFHLQKWVKKFATFQQFVMVKCQLTYNESVQDDYADDWVLTSENVAYREIDPLIDNQCRIESNSQNIDFESNKNRRHLFNVNPNARHVLSTVEYVISDASNMEIMKRRVHKLWEKAQDSNYFDHYGTIIQYDCTFDIPVMKRKSDLGLVKTSESKSMTGKEYEKSAMKSTNWAQKYPMFGKRASEYTTESDNKKVTMTDMMSLDGETGSTYYPARSKKPLNHPPIHPQMHRGPLIKPHTSLPNTHPNMLARGLAIPRSGVLLPSHIPPPHPDMPCHGSGEPYPRVPHPIPEPIPAEERPAPPKRKRASRKSAQYESKPTTSPKTRVLAIPRSGVLIPSHIPPPHPELPRHGSGEPYPRVSHPIPEPIPAEERLVSLKRKLASRKSEPPTKQQTSPVPVRPKATRGRKKACGLNDIPNCSNNTKSSN